MSQPPDRFGRFRAIQELESTFVRARVRVLRFSELVERIPGLLSDPDREEIIRRFREIEMNPTGGAVLLPAIQAFAEVSERLPSRDRARADAIVGRLSRTLPPPLGVPFALREVHHPRMKRREHAFKVLRDVDVPVDCLGDLVAGFQQTSDQKFLQLIARKPVLVVASDAKYLLSNLDERYWRMRVIESLLRARVEGCEQFRDEYPYEFAHAVGRSHAFTYAANLHALLPAHEQDPEFVAIYTWAMGVLGDKEAIEQVGECIVRLQQELDELDA